MAIDDRINIQKLQVFDAVVNLGGISRAADQMKVAQPVVTEHIQSLERRLGAKLFEREGRRLVLTEAGRLAHQWCTDVLRRTREFDRELQGLSDGLRGSIVIGTSMSTGSYELPTLLSVFARRYPDVRIRVDVTGAEQAIEATITGRNDLSVVAVQGPPALASLVSAQLGVDEVVLVAPPRGVTALARARALAGPYTKVLALGGIDASSAPLCREAGAGGVAVIRALLLAPDPARVAVALRGDPRSVGLAAEELRDSMLSVSGELNPEIGGIPVRPEMNLEAALQPRQFARHSLRKWPSLRRK